MKVGGRQKQWSGYGLSFLLQSRVSKVESIFTLISVDPFPSTMLLCRAKLCVTVVASGASVASKLLSVIGHT
jgi:hypothetical protein